MRKTPIIQREYSVTEYAVKLGQDRGKPITRAGVHFLIKTKKLPKGVSAKKVGNNYVVIDNSDKYKKKTEKQ